MRGPTDCGGAERKAVMLRVAVVMGVLARIALWISGLGLVLMTTFIAAQVFWRYVLNDSIIWTEPAAVMIMGWFIFLGAAVGIREGYHLAFDVVIIIVSQRTKLWLFTISDVAVATFGVGMVWFGWQLAARTVGNTIPSLGISGGARGPSGRRPTHCALWRRPGRGLITWNFGFFSAPSSRCC
jgi:TRAP-type C4-dicarboxylate transport system permease small subunit